MPNPPKLTEAEMSAFQKRVAEVRSNGGIPDQYTCPAINAALESRCIINFQISYYEGTACMNALNQVVDYHTKTRPLTVDDLEEIIPTLATQNINTLHLDGNGLTDETIPTLLSLLPKTIKTLMLRDNNLTQNAKEALATYSMINNCKITATIRTPDVSQKSGYKSAEFDFDPATCPIEESAAAAFAAPAPYDYNHDDSAAASHREILGAAAGAPGGSVFEDCDLT